MYNNLKYYPSGDSGLLIKFGDVISKEINKRIRAFVYCIEEMKLKEVIELIPTYNTILLIYNNLVISYEDLVRKIKTIENKVEDVKLPSSKVIIIPTLYGGEFGIDISFVAQYNKLTIKEVIDIHSSTNYLIHMLGFTPGFAYLGGMIEKIATPRLGNPREKILGGSVGIAGSQTGIYPIESPGGWRVIGRTPLKLFDPNRKPEVLLKAGDYLKFVPISKEEYNDISKKIKANEYKVKKTIIEGNE